jgi:hypothetical protein
MLEREMIMNALQEGPDDAAAALRLVQETQRKTAERMKAPAYYHPALGVIMAVIIASLEFKGPNYLIGVAMCALALIVTLYQKKTGVWATSFSGGPRAKRLMVAGLIALVALLFVGTRLKFRYDIDGAMIGAGVVGGLFATWLGYAWERAMLKDAGAS